MAINSEEAVKVKANDPLEDALLIIQAELSKTLDARLKTLEAKVELTHGILSELHGKLGEGEAALKELLDNLMENPLFKQIISGGFGSFPGFGG